MGSSKLNIGARLARLMETTEGITAHPVGLSQGQQVPHYFRARLTGGVLWLRKAFSVMYEENTTQASLPAWAQT